MKFETRMTWDAPAARVLAMFTNRRYFELKHELLAHESAEVLSCTDDGNVFSIDTRVRGKPTIKVPALAQKFVKADQAIEMDQNDTWDRSTARGSLKFVNKSVSQIHISAEMALRETDTGCENVISWTVECSLPLIGGKLAEILAEDIRAKGEKNQEVSRKILAEYF